MKKFLVSLLWLLLLGLFIWFIWDHLPNWGKWAFLGAFAVSVFWSVWTFLNNVLGMVFSHFSSLFTVLFSIFVTGFLGWMGWNAFFTTQSPTVASEDPLTAAINVIATSSSEIAIPSDQSSTVSFTVSSVAPSASGNTTVTKEEILSILKTNTEIGVEEKKYWEESLGNLTPNQLIELKEILQPETNTNTDNEIAVITATASTQAVASPVVVATNAITSKDNSISMQITIPETENPSLAATPTFSYGNDSKENWKQPIIVTPAALAEAISAPTKVPSLISSGLDDTKFIIPLQKTNAQMVFPLEYQISSVVWTDTQNARDEVSFAVMTNTNLRAFVTVSLHATGEKVEKYAQQFTSPLPEAHRFIISEHTDTSTTYTSFFAGMLWDIHVSLPFSENPTADDFYSVLLPMVFEAKK